jgi:hypothetical protein
MTDQLTRQYADLNTFLLLVIYASSPSPEIHDSTDPLLAGRGRDIAIKLRAGTKVTVGQVCGRSEHVECQREADGA